MKKGFKIILIILLALLVVGLFAGPSQSDYDAVVAENEALKEEIQKYQNTPDRLYAEVATLVQNKDIEALRQVCEQLRKYHPTSAECEQAQAALNKLIDEKEKAEKELNAKRLKAVDKLKKQYDDVEGITWYYNPYFTHYNNTNHVSLYIGKRDNGDAWLRLKMSYEGESWIFFTNAYLSYDGNTLEIPFNEFADKKSDNNTRVWEWIDVPVTTEIYGFIQQMVEGKSLKMRLSGKYSETRTLTKSEINGLKDVLLAYDVLLSGK